MEVSPLRIAVGLAAVVTQLASSPLHSQTADPTFDPNANGPVFSMAAQQDGKVLIGGDFTTVAGTNRSHLAQLDADGSLVPDFNPGVNGSVFSTAAQADGKIVLGGAFTTVGAATRERVAWMDADGTLTPGHLSDADNAVLSASIQMDGKVVLGGIFATVSGTGRNRIARLNANSSLDSAFNPDVGGTVCTTAIQADGKIVIGGTFGNVGALPRVNLARIDADNAVDLTFNPSANGSGVYSVAIQADGKIVIGGNFTSVAGTNRNCIARLNTDGTLDTDFNPGSNSDVYSMAVQADGKLVIGGNFTSVGGVTRNYIARLNANGTLDTGFNPDANGAVRSLAIQPDGMILVGGNFTSVGGATRICIARLLNDAATQALTVPDAGRIEWLRGGASPETPHVTFEISTDGGGTWTPLGAGTRIAGGWELTGLNLPGGGEVRARARTIGGQYNGSSGMMEAAVAFAVPVPEISVFDGNGTGGGERLNNTGSFGFSTTSVGSSSTAQTFTVQNTGVLDLTGLAVTKAGSHPGDFAVGTPGAATLAPGATTTFTVTFSPTEEGARNAVVQIASNDADENPFLINVSGNEPLPVSPLIRAYAWGANPNGQLGNGTTAQSNVPVAALTAGGALAGKTVVAIAAGASHNLALCSDGTLTAWGRNNYGQLGDGTTTDHPSPIAVMTAGGALAGKTVVAIAAGAFHNLALCSDGTLASWGYSDQGQLGDGTTAQRNVPVAVTTAGTPLAGKTVTAIAAGGFFSVALCSDGTLTGWGGNWSGQLGDGTTTQRNVPVAVTTAGTPLAGRTVVAVAGGSVHQLALCSDGTLAAWGYNESGELGDSTTTRRLLPVAVTTAGTPLAGKTVTAIAAGADHNLALCSDGTVASWGNNSDGQLGDNSLVRRLAPVAVMTAATALAGKTPAMLAGGFQHSAVLCSDGTMAAWGRNANGQLGTGVWTQSLVPQAVSTSSLPAGGYFTAVSVGSNADHTLALVAASAAPEIAVFSGTGTAPADERQSSSGSFSFATTAVGSSTEHTFTIANIGTESLTGLTLAKVGSDTGDFTLGTLGATTLGPDATTTFTVIYSPTGAGPRSATVQISGNDADENPFLIHVGGTDGTLLARYTTGDEVLVTAGSYTATGKIVDFALNYLPSPGTQLMVVKNTGLDFINGTFSNLAQGQTVGLGFGGNTYNFVADYYGGSGNDLVLVWAASRSLAWGQNANGQLGDNTTTQRNAPAPVTDTGVLAGRTVVAHAIGQTHSLALCSDGTLASWGQNNFGQLGDGTTTQSTVPVLVTKAGTPLAGKTVVAIAAGSYHSLALCSDGTLASWGYNSNGQLGDGTGTSRVTAVAVNTAGVLAGRKVVLIKAGYLFSVALCSDGTLASWGYSANGQLGSGGNGQSLLPLAVNMTGVLAGKTVVALAANVNHTLALCSDGTLAAWGFNFSGELGDGTTTSRLSPVLVTTTGTPLAGKTAVAITTGKHHSMALCSDGTLAAWGYNVSGQLGDGTTTAHFIPVAVTAAGTSLAGRTVVAITAGADHSAALCSDGTLAAWGKNASGQLGDGTATQSNVAVAVDTSSLAEGERFTRAVSGSFSDHTMALTAVVSLPFPEIAVFKGAETAFSAECQNNAGYAFPTTLDGASSSPQIFTVQNTGPVDLTGLALSKTGAHTGDFTLGALGATTLAPNATTTFTVTFSPAAVGARSAAVQIVSNDTDENPFVINLGGTCVTPLAATYTAAGDVPVTASTYTATGNIVNFALNYAPTTGTQLMVVKNTGLDFIHGTFSNLAQGQTVGLVYAGNTYNFVADYHGGSGNDLVLVWANTRALAWGQNSNGELGNNTTTKSTLPVPVTATGVLAGKTLVAIVAGQTHTLALCSDGTLAAWGQNNFGQLGDGTMTQRTVPVLVTATGTPLAGKTVAAIAAGDGHSLALCSDGTLTAWGDNTYGQVGDDTTAQRSVPVAVSTTGALSGKTIVAIASGSRHCLVLCSDGTLAAWGDNASGQLGDDTTTQRLAPVAVSTAGTPLAGRAVAAIAAGTYHNLALCSDGILTAWGYNYFGQIGDSTTTQRNAPVGVITAGTPLAGRTVASIAAGYLHCLAMCSDGTLAVWGNNANGQLANGSTAGSGYVPTAIGTAGTPLAGKTVASIAAGGFHNLALCSDGMLAAWGRNIEGQLGDATTTTRPVPVLVTYASLAPGERFIRAFSGSFANHTMAQVASGIPDISIFDGDGTGGAQRESDTGGFVFANTLVGANSTAQTFTIQNAGTASLTGLAVTKAGTCPEDFTVGALGATTLLPGATTTFTVTFSPEASGARNAIVQIASNDLDEYPFLINVGGTSLSAQENWRLIHFDNSSNTGDGADLNDFDHDCVINLIEFALGLDPTRNSAGQLPQAKRIGENLVISFTEPAGVSGITYGAEWSKTLRSGSWTSVSDTGIAPQHTFSVPMGTDETLFIRLTIGSP